MFPSFNNNVLIVWTVTFVLISFAFGMVIAGEAGSSAETDKILSELEESFDESVDNVSNDDSFHEDQLGPHYNPLQRYLTRVSDQLTSINPISDEIEWAVESLVSNLLAQTFALVLFCATIGANFGLLASSIIGGTPVLILGNLIFILPILMLLLFYALRAKNAIQRGAD